MKPYRVALVHDWLIHMRGGEKVLEALAELFPEATIYTLFYRRGKLSPVLQKMKIEASFLQKIPGIRSFYRWLLPFLPWTVRTLKIQNADVVISSSHCVAKGVTIPVGAVHLCYCHTPMRYLWGFEKDYFGNFPFFLKPFVRLLFPALKRADLESNSSVHQFISNSENVRRRIQTFYGRDAEVIYPPADLSFFRPEKGDYGDYYLVVSAFVPYKRVDLVIEAFNGLDRKLLIVGGGPLEQAYRKMRRSEKIFFLSSVSDPELRKLYARARALIFPTEEDFGIVPVEAQAAGTPVIAFAKGGALESVRTGVFFEEQTAACLQKTVLKFEETKFDRTRISAPMASFDKRVFKEKFMELLERALSQENVASHVPH